MALTEPKLSDQGIPEYEIQYTILCIFLYYSLFSLLTDRNLCVWHKVKWTSYNNHFFSLSSTATKVSGEIAPRPSLTSSRPCTCAIATVRSSAWRPCSPNPRSPPPNPNPNLPPPLQPTPRKRSLVPRWRETHGNENLNEMSGTLRASVPAGSRRPLSLLFLFYHVVLLFFLLLLWGFLLKLGGGSNLMGIVEVIVGEVISSHLFFFLVSALNYVADLFISRWFRKRFVSCYKT